MILSLQEPGEEVKTKTLKPADFSELQQCEGPVRKRTGNVLDGILIRQLTKPHRGTGKGAPSNSMLWNYPPKSENFFRQI